MSRKPWFNRNPSGGWWVPATPQGYATVLAWIVAVLATLWIPFDYRVPVLVGLGIMYLAGSFWLSQSRSIVLGQRPFPPLPTSTF